MIICDHGKDPKACPLCKSSLDRALAQVGAPPHPLAEPATGVAPALMAGVAPQPELIRIPNAHPVPEITDPQAKNVLQLAQEYAQAQDEVAKLSTLRFKLRAEAEEAQKNFEAAKLVCAGKQIALLEVVTLPHKPVLYAAPDAAKDINGDQ